MSSQGEEPASWRLRLHLVFGEAHQSHIQSEARVTGFFFSYSVVLRVFFPIVIIMK